MTRRVFLIVLAIAIGIAIAIVLGRKNISTRSKFQVPGSKMDVATSETPRPEMPGPSPDDDVRELHQAVGNFLTLVKDPYRPPVGDNEDIARALSGGNRLGEIFIATNDARLVDGKIVDRWGTPYWFHNRAPDAIDVRSAGPDRTLFTADDVTNRPGF